MEKSLLYVVGTSLLLSLLLSVAVYVIRGSFMPLRKTKQKKMLERAIRQGHVVTATLSSHRRTSPPAAGESFTQRDIAVYAYQYRGKTYRYRVLGMESPPEKLSLYFVRNPARAFPQSDFAAGSFRYWLFFLVSFALIALINLYSSGYIGG